MAIDTRKTLDAVALNLATQFNALQKWATTLGTTFHADVTSTSSGDLNSLVATAVSVTGGACSVLADVVAKGNLCKKIYNLHIADANAHKAADTANPVTTADCTDQTTANTLLNAIKTKFNLHLAQSGVHYTNDSTNTVGTTNATTLDTSKALADALQAAINAHITSSPTSSMLNVVGA